MSQGGPKPTAFYVERQALTRLPATPTVPGANGALLATSNQSLGQTDPGIGTTRPGDGLVLGGLMALAVSVYANPGQTLSGAGSLLCWIFNPYQAVWTRCYDLDLDMTAATSCPARTFPSNPIPARQGVIINWLTSGVTVSGGTDVLVRIDGFQSVLGMTS